MGNDVPIWVYLGALISAVMLFIAFLPWSAIVLGIAIVVAIANSIANAPLSDEELFVARLEQEAALRRKVVTDNVDVAQNALTIDYNETVERMRSITDNQPSESAAAHRDVLLDALDERPLDGGEEAIAALRDALARRPDNTTPDQQNPSLRSAPLGSEPITQERDTDVLLAALTDNQQSEPLVHREAWLDELADWSWPVRDEAIEALREALAWQPKDATPTPQTSALQGAPDAAVTAHEEEDLKAWLYKPLTEGPQAD